MPLKINPKTPVTQVPTDRSTPEAPTCISTVDLSLFQKAQASLQQSNAIYQFTMVHLCQVYQLSPADTFDAGSGAITRAQVAGGADA